MVWIGWARVEKDRTEMGVVWVSLWGGATRLAEERECEAAQGRLQ